MIKYLVERWHGSRDPSPGSFGGVGIETIDEKEVIDERDNQINSKKKEEEKRIECTEGKLLFQCITCDRKSGTKKYLRRHKAKLHQYQCNSCDKKICLSNFFEEAQSACS